MSEQTNFKENLTQEEMESLAATLYYNMKDFFKTKLSKKLLEENSYKTKRGNEKSA